VSLQLIFCFICVSSSCFRRLLCMRCRFALLSSCPSSPFAQLSLALLKHRFVSDLFVRSARLQPRARDPRDMALLEKQGKARCRAVGHDLPRQRFGSKFSCNPTAALSGYSEAGGGSNLEVRAVDDGGAVLRIYFGREKFSHSAAECVPLLRHKSKAKVGSEVQSWARGGAGSILGSDGELFDDAEGVQ
jgi:hypothetical protein